MLNRTREWLDYYRFPPGPVVVSDRFADVLHQLEWKKDTLKQLRMLYPSLLVSIGNRELDIRSALPNMILPLTVQSVENDTKDDHGTLFLQDWEALGEFFRINRQVLVDPARLGQAIRGGIPLQQPVRDPAGRYYYVLKCINCESGEIVSRPRDRSPGQSGDVRQDEPPAVSRDRLAPFEAGAGAESFRPLDRGTANPR